MQPHTLPRTRARRPDGRAGDPWVLCSFCCRWRGAGPRCAALACAATAGRLLHGEVAHLAELLRLDVAELDQAVVRLEVFGEALFVPENEGEHIDVDARWRGEAGGDAGHRGPGDEHATRGGITAPQLAERTRGREANAFAQGVVAEFLFELVPRTKAAVAHLLGVLDVGLQEFDERFFLRLGLRDAGGNRGK
jgi:hypothetical protein